MCTERVFHYADFLTVFSIKEGKFIFKKMFEIQRRIEVKTVDIFRLLFHVRR